MIAIVLLALKMDTKMDDLVTSKIQRGKIKSIILSARPDRNWA